METKTTPTNENKRFIAIWNGQANLTFEMEFSDANFDKLAHRLLEIRQEQVQSVLVAAKKLQQLKEQYANKTAMYSINLYLYETEWQLKLIKETETKALHEIAKALYSLDTL